jgi:thiosulfate dehydrogenase
VKFAVVALLGCALLVGCAHGAGTPAPTVAYDSNALPSGQLGTQIRYGREIIMSTRHALPHNVTANMDCAACHIDGGTKPHGGSFLGIYAQFPQWNKRSHRIITMQDRIAECFLYSENGKPPAFWSREMIAVVSYIAWLSRGTPFLSPKSATQAQRFDVPMPTSPPDKVHGAQLFAQKCAMCHGAKGAGNSVFPPLWGARSFNNGAGMHRLAMMTGFVYYNMPKNAPGTLSLADAYDISAFVLSHKRPAFRKSALIAWPAERASYF